MILQKNPIQNNGANISMEHKMTGTKNTKADKKCVSLQYVRCKKMSPTAICNKIKSSEVRKPI